MGDFDPIALLYQLPIVAFFFLALHRRWLVTGDRWKTDREAAIEQLAKANADAEDRLNEMRTDRDFWRSISLRSLGVAERATQRSEA